MITPGIAGQNGLTASAALARYRRMSPGSASRPGRQNARARQLPGPGCSRPCGLAAAAADGARRRAAIRRVDGDKREPQRDAAATGVGDSAWLTRPLVTMPATG